MNLNSSFVSICIFVVVFGALQYITGPLSPIRSRALPAKAEFGEIPKTIDTSACTIDSINVPNHRISPTFLPSYPGSGTKLQWSIVEALTGMPTTDDQFSNGHHNVAGIKTHYPCLAGKEFPGAEEIKRAIIFVRHPMDALPAYFDMIHAAESDEGYDPEHVPIASIESWVEWRDHSFARELDTWRKHLEYWADRYKSLDRLVISYEQFITPQFGPTLTGKIAEFLTRSTGVTTKPAEEVPCVWHHVIAKEFDGKQNLNEELDGSVVSVRRRLQMQGGQQGNRMQQNPKQSNQWQQQPQSATMNQQQSGSNNFQRTNDNFQQNNNNPVQETRSQNSMGQGRINSKGQQKPNTSGQQSRQMDPTPQEDTRVMQQDHPQSQSQQSRQDQPQSQSQTSVKSSGTSTKQTRVQPNASAQSNVAPAEPEEESPLLKVKEIDTVVRKPGESISELINRVQKSKAKEKDEQLTQNEDTSEEMDSMSGRPYTGEQKKEIIVMLAQLLEKYGSDRVLTPLMVEYIDSVERRHKMNQKEPV